MAVFAQILIYLLLISSMLYSIGLFINKPLQRYRRWFAIGNLLGILSVMVTLWILIFQNRFEYNYIWSHSSKELPAIYKFSSLWEGQEGSFLLWIFWNSVILMVLSFANSVVSKAAIKYFLIIQTCLLTMVLGLKISNDVSIGLSPFALLKDSIYSPVYDLKPDFIPADGSGMNSLLMNYWMVIHPPVIFLGFALSVVPFAFCLSGIQDKTNWINKAFPWMLASALFISMGMFMGAYWAYETLNFGGFWSWDPVENAIYIPWIVSIVALHLMIVFRKTKKAYNSTVISVIASFVLVVYSTFLTRSGVLGDSSVHSFTGSGLSTQLLVFLLVSICLPIVVYVKNQVYRVKKTSIGKFYSFSDWVSFGMLVLVLAAFQVFLPTSFPVFNSIAHSFGGRLNLAPPVDAVSFYTNYQQWFALTTLIIMVIAQLYYWGYGTVEKVLRFSFIPIVISIVSLEFIFGFLGGSSTVVVALVIVGSFVVWMNIMFLYRRTHHKKLGGAISHLGVSILFLAIVLSQGYRKVLTANEFKGKLNTMGNVFLEKGKPVEIGEYELEYEDMYVGSNFLSTEKVSSTLKSNVVTAKDTMFYNGRTYLPTDSIRVNTSLKYYAIKLRSGADEMTLLPKVVQNSSSDIVVSPFINHGPISDVFAHVSNYPDPSRASEKEAWITLKVEEFPFISMLWLGCVLIMLGFGLSLIQSFQFVFKRSKREVEIAPEIRKSLVHLIHN